MITALTDVDTVALLAEHIVVMLKRETVIFVTLAVDAGVVSLGMNAGYYTVSAVDEVHSPPALIFNGEVLHLKAVNIGK